MTETLLSETGRVSEPSYAARQSELASDAPPESASARALGDISREMRAMAASYRPALFRPAEVALYKTDRTYRCS